MVRTWRAERLVRLLIRSPDYSAPLKETREIEAKFQQTKLIALFTRVSQDLLETYMESNGSGNALSTDEIYSWVIQNPYNGARFYTLQQTSTPSRSVVTFSAYLNTSLGTVSPKFRIPVGCA